MSAAAVGGARSLRPLLPSPALWRFVAKRLATAVVLLVGIIVVAFVLTSILPGDPATASLGERAAADPAIVAAARARLGIDRPLWEQFGGYVAHLVRCDLGVSIQTRQPVLEDLQRFAPASAELAAAATIVAVLIGVGGGIVAALRVNRWPDQVLRLVSLGGLSVPIFWLALLVVSRFATRLRWFPPSGRLTPGETPPPRVTGFYTIDALLAGDPSAFGSAVSHLVLPAAVLAAPMVGLLLRFTRSSLLEVLGNEYVRAAEAKGLRATTVVRRHILRAALVPVITVLGTAFASLLAGTVLVEQIFAWPGIGSYAYRSTTTLDLPAIVGVTLFIAVVYVVVNLVVDLVYGVVDPRIRVA